MKNIPLIFASVIACMTFASCSQEEQDTRPQVVNAPQQQHTTVEKLTAQLKTYNSQFELRQDVVMREASSGKVRLKLSDKIKIALADAAGGCVGALFGGPYGAVVTGATASYFKRLWIMEKRGLKIENVMDKYAEAFIGNGVFDNFSDSVGCYHNIVENQMHTYYDYKYKPSEREMLSHANAFMRHTSDGYKANIIITDNLLSQICSSLTPITKLSDSDDVTFSEYTRRMKIVAPRHSASIEYFANYLYTLAYANIEDPEQYTLDVINQVKSSNASDADKEQLISGLQMAHASLLYSTSINYSSK